MSITNLILAYQIFKGVCHIACWNDPALCSPEVRQRSGERLRHPGRLRKCRRQPDVSSGTGLCSLPIRVSLSWTPEVTVKLTVPDSMASMSVANQLLDSPCVIWRLRLLDALNKPGDPPDRRNDCATNTDKQRTHESLHLILVMKA